MPLLESTWRALIRTVRDDSNLAPKYLYLAGKSMGGRVASHVAAQGESCDGLIFLGYPLHPANQAGKLRVEHWANLSCPVLFVQGKGDALCDLEVQSLSIRIPALVSVKILVPPDDSERAAFI